jgi:mRNA interferase HigB
LFDVHVISRRPLVDFSRRHSDARNALAAWFKLARKGTFRDLPELKRTFGGVDYLRIGEREFYVFNVGGNKCRLIAAVHFNTQKLFVRYVLTHAEYDRGDWKR